MAKWKHSELGSFEYDGSDWVGKVQLPAFKAFQYDSGFDEKRSRNAKFEVAIQTDDESETPSAEAIELVLKVVANEAQLAKRVTAALWNDFSGGKPKSGMWWHGNLDEVAEAMDSDAPPEEEKDLYSLLSFSRIAVRPGHSRAKQLVTELTFSAPFEEEHGVGFLTDGEAILGIGYSSDVTPFKSRK